MQKAMARDAKPLQVLKGFIVEMGVSSVVDFIDQELVQRSQMPLQRALTAFRFSSQPGLFR
jgi:hypothetical protein